MRGKFARLRFVVLKHERAIFSSFVPCVCVVSIVRPRTAFPKHTGRVPSASECLLFYAAADSSRERGGGGIALYVLRTKDRPRVSRAGGWGGVFLTLLPLAISKYWESMQRADTACA